MSVGECRDIAQPASEISMVDLISVIWARKWLFLAAIVVGALLAGISAMLVGKTYEAKVVLAPVSDEIGSASGMGGGGTGAGGLSGIAALVGIMTPNSSEKAISLATLESDGLTSHFIEGHKLSPVLFPKMWDSVHGGWKASVKAPTLWEATKFFNKKVRFVEDDKKNGLVVLVVRWNDPRLAAAWANGLVREANEVLKARALAEADKNIAYLNQQANETNVVEMRQTIYSLLRGEINKYMLAQGSDEYALRVVDAAVAPERPSSPMKLLWMASGAIAGMIAAVFLILVQSFGVRRAG